MPLLFALVVVMVVYGATMSGFRDAFDFVFRPDPQRLKASGVLEALGHAFFTLSLGMGAMITYGSYQQSKESLAAESAIIATLDTVISLLACLMIFPITFSYGQAPSAGPGLVFVSMPLAFAEIGAGGMLLAILFFALLCVAALASAISLLEVVVSYFIDERGWSRRRAAWLLGLVILAFAVPSAFSGDSRFPMTGWNTSYGRGFFDTMDYVASNWMLPLAGLLISIYAGWVMPRRVREAELRGAGQLIVTGWLLLIRFVAPVLVTLVLLQQVGFLDADELFHGMFGR
jgi:NSS family neurotransmitter:Na+ symporter